MTQDGGTRGKRHGTVYDKILFGILMALLFLPLLQAHVLHIPLKPLNGMTVETEKPEFDFAAYRLGDYAKQEEAYLGAHFGFREPIIRLYNQYLWSCYHKTFAHDVMAGKKGWLYTPESVSDYYGTELLRWQPSVAEARQNFDREVKYMNWIRTILKENDVEFLAFIAPEKSFLYPEYLPEKERDTTTFNACDHYMEKFEEIGFPCIDMTHWFQRMKDTTDYPLIPQTGGHWMFPAVIAADSLFRFMGDLKGIELPKLKIGALHESDNHGADNDLEQLLNLAPPIRKHNGYSPTAEVTMESSPNNIKPKVLFVGNSFMWGIVNQVPMTQVFDNVEFWYYFSTIYRGNPLTPGGAVVDLNLLEKFLDFDYIVWFTTGNQLNKGTMSFAQTALLTLAVDDSVRLDYIHRIADTLTCEGSDSLRLREARSLLYKHPEWIPELQGDSLNVRNKELPYAKIIKDIRKDSLWMAALRDQGLLRTAALELMLHAEADHILQGRPLYKDQLDELQFAQHCQREIVALMEKMRGDENLMQQVREKAEKNNKTLDKALEDDARWLVRRKYGLDRCRLTDNPDAEIPLPP
jgi:hypothetical protein